MTETYPKHNQQTPIFVNGRVIGHVRGDTFHKSVKREWQLRTPPAWAFEASSLADATAAGAQYVELRVRETGATLRASIETIREHGRYMNRGHGDQVFLTLKHWRTPDGAPVVMPFELKMPEPYQAPQPVQPSLFTEVAA